MKRMFLALMAAVLAPAGAVAAPGFAPAVFTNSSGATLPYRWLAPEAPAPGRRYPLVLFLHGAGERGTDNRAQLVHGTRIFLAETARRDFPCYVVAPQCPANQQWVDMPWGADSGKRPVEPSSPMRLAMDLLDRLVRELPVDTNRLYVTGLSMGGFGTWDLVSRQPGRFAAAVPVCGGGDPATLATVARLPVWTFHSTDDSVVKVNRTREMVAALRAGGGKPHYTEFRGLGHNSWDKAYSQPELLPWMFSQRRGEADAYVFRAGAVPGAGPDSRPSR